MPSVEFVCDDCGQEFARLFFRGEDTGESYCVSCGSRRVRREPGPQNLFGDRVPFGELSKDKN